MAPARFSGAESISGDPNLFAFVYKSVLVLNFSYLLIATAYGIWYSIAAVNKFSSLVFELKAIEFLLQKAHKF
jgi:hypothetical protein